MQPRRSGVRIQPLSAAHPLYCTLHTRACAQRELMAAAHAAADLQAGHFAAKARAALRDSTPGNGSAAAAAAAADGSHGLGAPGMAHAQGRPGSMRPLVGRYAASGSSALGATGDGGQGGEKGEGEKGEGRGCTGGPVPELRAQPVGRGASPLAGNEGQPMLCKGQWNARCRQCSSCACLHACGGALSA